MWVDALKGDVKRCLAKQYRMNDVGVHETITVRDENITQAGGKKKKREKKNQVMLKQPDNVKRGADSNKSGDL